MSVGAKEGDNCNLSNLFFGYNCVVYIDNVTSNGADDDNHTPYLNDGLIKHQNPGTLSAVNLSSTSTRTRTMLRFGNFFFWPKSILEL